MRTRLQIILALRSLRRHPFRSFLTVLGIVIGIAAIISTFAIGRGAEQRIEEQIRSMGKNYIVLSPRAITDPTKQKKKVKPLTFKEVKIIKAQSPEINHISPVIDLQQEISYGRRELYVRIKSGYSNFLNIITRTIQIGSFFDKGALKKGRKIVILGSKTAEELFYGENPLNKIILIKNKPFTVIGVLKPVVQFGGITDPNYDCFIPITTAQKTFYTRISNNVHYIIISLHAKEDATSMVRKLARILRHTRHLTAEEDDDFTIWDQQAIAEAAQRSIYFVRLFILIAASISLLVGGIGVMNIMLVAVTERTREIGIRLAIGATSAMIQTQFLIESIALCIIGGIIGIILGIVVSFTLGIFTDFRIILEVLPALIGLIITSLVGIFFGFYPAYKASQLDPVACLTQA